MVASCTPRRSWAACCEARTAADSARPLTGEDPVLLSVSSYLAGSDEASLEKLARAYHCFEEAHDWPRATRSAFWLTFMLGGRGEPARASGWGERVRSIVETHALEGAERGYLLALRAHEMVATDRLGEALAPASEAAEVGRRVGDPDLRALGQLSRGKSLAGLDRGAEALPVLDEIMVAAADDELSPAVAGLAYCAVISTCLRLFDLRRAREWTTALTSWCARQPSLVPYRGSPRVGSTRPPPPCRLCAEPGRTDRAEILTAFVEAMLATSDPEAARAARDELRTLADAMAMPCSGPGSTRPRRLSNIYAKLGIASRAAATAWAFQHQLV